MPQLARRVLLVEDDAALLRAMVQLLTIYGFEVLPAASLDVALSQLILQPDIILTDLNLPDGSGLDLLRKVRRVDPSATIAVMTANDQHAREAQASFPDAIFRKPFDADAMIAWLENPRRGSR